MPLPDRYRAYKIESDSESNVEDRVQKKGIVIIPIVSPDQENQQALGGEGGLQKDDKRPDNVIDDFDPALLNFDGDEVDDGRKETIKEQIMDEVKKLCKQCLQMTCCCIVIGVMIFFIILNDTELNGDKRLAGTKVRSR